MRRSPGGSVFLPFGFVSAHLQVFFNLRIRQRPMIGTARQKAKIQLPHRYIISVNALMNDQARMPGADRAIRHSVI